MCDRQSFSYVKVGKHLQAQLLARILAGKGSVVLGSRFSGKRYVLARLHESLRQEDAVVVKLDMLDNPPVKTSQELVRAIEAGVKDFNPLLYADVYQRPSAQS